MPKKIDYWNMPYCYGYDTTSNTEILFGRSYQPLARRRFLDGFVQTIEAFKNKGQIDKPCLYCLFIEHDFKAWFYDDGNSARSNMATRRLVIGVWDDFLKGIDVRDRLYNVHRDFRFPDCTVRSRFHGMLEALSPFDRRAG